MGECVVRRFSNQRMSGSESTGLTFALQALLDRHETYMAESEEERRVMAGTIEKLSEDKRNLEVENARIIEENRELLDQLEGLNNAISDSDAQIKSLNATLVAAQIEVRRLSSLAARTADLEAQLMELELGNMRLEEELSTSKEDRTSAMTRWRQAELTIQHLSEQIERIEKEARDEKERHVELISRMERRRVVDSELNGAAGRLKGAAAVQSLNRNGAGTTVVSHFVKDILQDNANLQAGVLELREMLELSNVEVQSLREQIMLHQPVTISSQGPVESLSDELERSTSRFSQEVHVHHHYHTPTAKRSAVRKDRAPVYRGRKPRSSLTPVSTGRLSSTPLPDRSLPFSPTTSANTPTANRTPSNRWSMQSSATGLSIATLSSSPSSAYRRSSIFDQLEAEYDSSRPTSPESLAVSSPHFTKGHKKEMSDFSIMSLGSSAFKVNDPSRLRSYLDSTIPPADEEPENDGVEEFIEPESRDVSPGTQGYNEKHPCDPVIPEETESETAVDLATPESSASMQQDTGDYLEVINHPRLRRAGSHESLISVSGMDIHTLKERPSQLFFANRNPSVSRGLASTTGPYTSTVEVHASPSTSATAREELASQKLLSGLVVSRAPRRSSPTTVERSNGSPFGKLIGGWSPWGGGRAGLTPPSTSGSSTALNTDAPATPSANRSTRVVSEPAINFLRTAGVNQKGPIRGFRPPPRAPSAVHAQQLDENLLKESLLEE